LENQLKNAHEFPGLYDDLFDFPSAGYVMLDVDSPLVADTGFLEDHQYISDDPNLYWMKGLATEWPATVRVPLDPKVRQKHVKQVIEGIDIPRYLRLGDIEVFPSPYPDQDYVCIVARVEDEWLVNLNAQLAVLPGVQTYIPYKAHVTIGYFDGNVMDRIGDVKQYLDTHVETIGFNYGRMLP
jgi:hypothetical protein